MAAQAARRPLHRPAGTRSTRGACGGNFNWPLAAGGSQAKARAGPEGSGKLGSLGASANLNVAVRRSLTFRKVEALARAAAPASSLATGNAGLEGLRKFSTRSA
jgi:hypothetical protein